jgi:hypothetical protein
MPTDRPRHSSLQTRVFHVEGDRHVATKPGIVGDLEWVCHLLATSNPDPELAEAIRRLKREAMPRLEADPIPNDAHLVEAYQKLRRENDQNQQELRHQQDRNRRLLQFVVEMGDELSKAGLQTPAIYLEALSDVGRPLTDADQAEQEAGWKELMESMPPGGRVD